MLRIGLIEDEQENIETLMEALSTQDIVLEPLQITDFSIRGIIEQIADSRLDAVLCDETLDFPGFPLHGSEIAAEINRRKIVPTVLDTAWLDQYGHTRIRRHLRNLPSVVAKEDLEPDLFPYLVEKCLRDFAGDPLPERRTYRSILEVQLVQSEKDALYVIVPDWNEDHVVTLPLDLVEDEQLRNSLTKGQLLFAEINTAAKSQFELFFFNFEAASLPNPFIVPQHV